MCQLDAPQRHLLLERLARLPETAHLFASRASNGAPTALSTTQCLGAASSFLSVGKQRRRGSAAGTAGDGSETDMDRLLQKHVKAVRQGCAAAAALNPVVAEAVEVDPVAAAAAVDPVDLCAPPPGRDLTVQLVPEFLQYTAGGAHEVKMVVSLKVGACGYQRFVGVSRSRVPR